MDEYYLKAFRILEVEPSLSQRVLAKRLDMSLGKANYLLNSMINEGYVRAVRFKNSSNKRAYMYYLTPEGFKRKMDLTLRFLHLKAREFELLQQEIEVLKQEVTNGSRTTGPTSGWNTGPVIKP
jgi:EPS-associated MarR family transcriptional regulator